MQATSTAPMNPVHSSAMKRLAREAVEMQESDSYLHAQPVEDNLFEWHFTIRGQSDTDFEHGIYHGRLTFPSNYPLSPPEIVMLTPNGVFETDKKICLSMSSYHPETWLPSWSIRTGLLALIGFMPNCPEGVLGYVKRSSDERHYLAKKSIDYHCSICNSHNGNVLKPLSLNERETNDTNEPSNETQSSIYQSQRPEDLWNSGPRQDSSTSTLSSFLTSTFAIIFIFFVMRNVYLWSNPPIDF